MSLHTLSDTALLTQTQSLVHRERELLTQILKHLREIEKRRLYSQQGCSSLFTYCTKILKYSEAQAQRRISAMRLLREIPEIEKKVASGALTLTNISQAQRLFRQKTLEEKIKGYNSPQELHSFQPNDEKGQGRGNSKEGSIQNTSTLFTKEDKKQILKQLEHKSSREGERLLLSFTESPVKTQERERVLTEDLTEVKFIADAKLLKKMKRLKGLIAHRKPHANYAELIDELCEISLQQLDPRLKKGRTVRKSQSMNDLEGRVKKREIKNTKETQSLVQAPLQVNSCALSNSGNRKRELQSHTKVQLERRTQRRGKNLEKREEDLLVARHGTKRKYLSVLVKQKVWERAEGKCQNCASEYALQIDHILPISLNGDSSVENLRLLCRACNQRAAIEKLGAKKMERYLE